MSQSLDRSKSQKNLITYDDEEFRRQKNYNQSRDNSLNNKSQIILRASIEKNDVAKNLRSMIYNRDLQQMHKNRRMNRPKFFINNGSMLKVLKDVKPVPI